MIRFSPTFWTDLKNNPHPVATPKKAIRIKLNCVAAPLNKKLKQNTNKLESGLPNN